MPPPPSRVLQFPGALMPPCFPTFLSSPPPPPYPLPLSFGLMPPPPTLQSRCSPRLCPLTHHIVLRCSLVNAHPARVVPPACPCHTACYYFFSLSPHLFYPLYLTFPLKFALSASAGVSLHWFPRRASSAPPLDVYLLPPTAAAAGSALKAPRVVHGALSRWPCFFPSSAAQIGTFYSVTPTFGLGFHLVVFVSVSLILQPASWPLLGRLGWPLLYLFTTCGALSTHSFDVACFSASPSYGARFPAAGAVESLARHARGAWCTSCFGVCAFSLGRLLSFLRVPCALPSLEVLLLATSTANSGVPRLVLFTFTHGSPPRPLATSLRCLASLAGALFLCWLARLDCCNEVYPPSASSAALTLLLSSLIAVASPFLLFGLTTDFPAHGVPSQLSWAFALLGVLGLRAFTLPPSFHLLYCSTGVTRAVHLVCRLPVTLSPHPLILLDYTVSSCPALLFICRCRDIDVRRCRLLFFPFTPWCPFDPLPRVCRYYSAAAIPAPPSPALYALSSLAPATVLPQ